MQIVIVAGGGGTRLWPLSTKQQPKQFVPLFDKESLLVKTYNRIRQTFSPDQIWVATIPEYIETTKSLLPAEFDRDHVIAEPEKRDTFGAICGHAAYISHYVGENEPISMIQADHLLADAESQLAFNQTLLRVSQSLQNGEFDIIALAVKPTFPSTQYGYIQINQSDVNNVYDSIVPVVQFKEKPDLQTAQSFLNLGNYLWNVCPSSFTYASLKRNISEFQPETLSVFENIAKTGSFNKEEYLSLPKTSFDYAIAEKSNKMGVAGMQIKWEDVGSWDVIASHLPDLDHLPKTIQVEGSNNKAKLTSSKKVAFVGVSDLLLIETEDGILVIDPRHSAKTKDVAQHFENN